MNQFRAASVFSNHMVLQRNKNINVFGEGLDGELVSVSFLGEMVETKVVDGKWMAVLSPREAATGLEMIVRCKEQEIRFIHIAIGEVWLAGGQSNMEYELQNCTGGNEFLTQDENSNVRFYYTMKRSYMDEEFFAEELKSSWKEFNSEDAKSWSAVGYLYAKQLAKELGVTVGVIGCNWGGTSASAWMDTKNLVVDQELNTYVEEYQKATQGKSIEQQIKEYKEYEAYHADWEKRSSQCYANDPEITWAKLQEICGLCQWPGPMCCINPYRPGGLYECMLKRVMPYTIRGFIYYQGESDDHKPEMYYKLFSRMIQQWREDWGDLELPFLFVQLPMHRYKQDPDFKNWCKIREAQMKVYQTIKHTGIAVCIDCGEFNEIHPKDKLPVANRLALQALYEVYHKVSESVANGPRYQSMVMRKSEIDLLFTNAESGFLVKDSNGEFENAKIVEGFEVAGEDKEFVSAKAEVHGAIITVSSEQIVVPKYVRYCWTNYGPVSLFGKNKLPLAPFRTSPQDQKLEGNSTFAKV